MPRNDENSSQSYLPRVSTPGYPPPSPWGARGPPSRLRRLTLGVPIEPRTYSAGNQLPKLFGAQGGGSSSSSAMAATSYELSEELPRLSEEEDVIKPLRAATARLQSCQSRDKIKPASWRVLRWPRRLPPHQNAGSRCGGGVPGGLKQDPSTSSLGTCSSTSYSFRTGCTVEMSTKALRSHNISELRRVLREEFQTCTTPREVEKVCSNAGRIISAGTAEQFGVTGRFALKLREVTKHMRDSSFAAIDVRYKIVWRKTLARESKHRTEQLMDAEGMRTDHFFTQDSGGEAEALPLPSGSLGHRLVKIAPGRTIPVSTVSIELPSSGEAVAGGGGVADAAHPQIAVQSLMEMLGRMSSNGNVSLADLNSQATVMLLSQSEHGQQQQRNLSSFIDWLSTGSGRQFGIDDSSTVSTGELEHMVAVYVEAAAQAPSTQGMKVSAPPAAGRLVAPEASPSEKRSPSKASSVAASEDTGVKQEEQWSRAFAKYKDDGEVHRDDLKKVLELSGFGSPDESCVEEAVVSVTKFSTLKLDEYIRFVHEYITCQDVVYHQAFKDVDEDNSGELEVLELKNLLCKLNIEPMPHVLHEVIDEVDDDKTGSLNFEEFTKVMNLIKTREGFTRKEYEAFTDLFGKYDRDKSGEIDSQELIGILTFLGISMEKKDVDKLVEDVDVDGSGQISSREYLTCMRKVRDCEVTKMKFQIKQNDADGSGTIDLKEFRTVLMGLGFPHIEMEAVVECVQQVGFEVENAEFDVYELWQVIVVYREREGFRAEEIKEIADAFERYDKANEGEMSVLELGKLLRFLGYPCSFEVQKQLVAKVDLDGSGRISLPELRKLIRMYQSRGFDEIHQAFKKWDPDNSGVLSVGDTEKALKYLGCSAAKKFLAELGGSALAPTLLEEEDTYPSSPAFSRQRTVPNNAFAKKVSDMTMGKDTMGRSVSERRPDRRTSSDTLSGKGADSGISVASFVRAMVMHKRDARAAFRENSGFAPTEIEQFRESFQRYDRDGSGDISKREMVPLIEDSFPTMAHDPAMRPRLIQLVADADADGSGSLEFQDFLRLMALINDIQAKEQLEKEQIAIAATTFSQREVEEFRESFLYHSAQQTMLGIDEVERMLGMICPLGARNAAELLTILEDIVSKMRQEEMQITHVNFPEFLVLMHKLLEVDFAGIAERLKKYSA